MVLHPSALILFYRKEQNDCKHRPRHHPKQLYVKTEDVAKVHARTTTLSFMRSNEEVESGGEGKEKKKKDGFRSADFFFFLKEKVFDE